ncbi:MAG: oxidoreductase [Gemmatimonadaceae bacterium]
MITRGRFLTRRAAALALALCACSGPARAQWTPLPSPTNVSLRGLSVVDARTVWASGAKGTVVHSVDGGNSWRLDTIPGASAFDLRSIHARDSRVAHVAATAGRIWRTTDAGATWSLRYQAADTSVFLDAVDFWDDRHGIALGDPIGGRFFLLVTDDGGDTWREPPVASRPVALEGEAAFAASGSSLALQGTGDSMVAWIGSGGRSARLHRSLPHLSGWTAYETPMRQGGAAEGIFSIAILPTGGLFLVGGNYSQDDSARANAATSVTGAEWSTRIAVPPRGYRSGVAFASTPAYRAVGLAVGPGGSDRSRDGGVTWLAFDRAGYHAVRATRDAIFFASGSEGRLARFDARPTR